MKPQTLSHNPFVVRASKGLRPLLTRRLKTPVNPELSIVNPQPQTLNPETTQNPKTLNLNPYTLNPEPKILYPQPNGPLST